MNSSAFEIFRNWFDEAKQANIAQPNAMALATTDIEDNPTVRMVLLSSFDDRGFVFHTNYNSDKGQQLARIPWAALLFWWEPIGRQIRIEGPVDKTSSEESDAYFATRPRGSQLGAWASEQSQVIATRASLDSRLQTLEIQYANQPVPRPSHWGGYRVAPHKFEFWTARDNRLHDRMLYERTTDGAWEMKQLSP